MQMSSSSLVLSLPFPPIPPSTAKFTPRCLKNCRVVFEKAARSKMVGTHLRGVPYLVLYLGQLGEPSLPKDGGPLARFISPARPGRPPDAQWGRGMDCN